ncbi:MAG: hypothetical protein RIR70_1082 [Pseudomonadota bacterium]|jgi:hypothetical protein
MWGLLVVISGSFFYTVSAIMNARAVPNPTTVVSQSKADSMYLLSQIAKKKKADGTWTGSVPLDQSLLKRNYKYIDPNWQAKIVAACVITYKTPAVDLSDARKFTASLGKYASNARLVGYVNASGTIVAASENGPTLAGSSIPSDLRSSPFIYDCGS